MRKHIRTDTFKVYEDEAKILDSIIMDRKLHPRQGKSKAYRVALHTYKNLHELPQSVESLKAQIEILTEQVKQLYFIIQGGMK